MEFYQTGRVAWPTESENITCKQLEEELDYFQIFFKKSIVICSSALETARNNLNNIIWGFEELIICCCNYLINNIKFEIGSSGICVIDNYSSDRHFYDLQDLQKFGSSKFTHPETLIILDNTENILKLFS
ncbi:13005_t:CDS:1 [Dentiscutata erythropus]|uniref:13005_t:CDS:1 n=1 Tax=Dentiscutata erythropus TaxID=1348616 RepID=A0A9N9P5N9_9GLOM|nr:13005_t:CDS:1 [Dentiscutata erythropus]